MGNKGVVTEKVQDLAQRLLGRKIDTVELRLMPYIQYVMVNEQTIEPNKINKVERVILRKWKDAGHVEGGAGGLGITKEFWDIINEIIFLSYVDV